MNMKQVKVNHGIHRNDIFSGTFELVTKYHRSYIPGPKAGKIEILDLSGKRVGIWVNPEDIAYLGTAAETTTVDISDQELSDIILDRFNTLDDMTCGIINKDIRALIVSGAPGVGKTFTLVQALKQAVEEGSISKYTVLSGTASALGLYEALWNHREEGEVLLVDDTDSIFYDSDPLNILKAALDSGDTRTITWATDSRFLRQEEIPKSFEFNGSVVFISNEDFDKRIEKEDKISKHLEALMSRCMYLDLAIHSNRAIMLRIKQVVFGSDMLDKKGCSEEQKRLIISWMEQHIDQFRLLSIRTADQIASLIRMQPKNWERTAKSTLFKPQRLK